jgi:hypothetical protein
MRIFIVISSVLNKTTVPPKSGQLLCTQQRGLSTIQDRHGDAKLCTHVGGTGKDYPYEGDPGTASVSLKKIDANTIEETDKRNGNALSVSRMTVAADGKSMKIAVQDKLHNQTANWTAEKE